MDQSQIMEVGAKAMWVTLQVSMPVLGVSLVVGLLVSIFQAVTQLQEPTLTFIPKILAVVVVIVIAGPWMLNTMLGFTIDLWAGIPRNRPGQLGPHAGGQAPRRPRAPGGALHAHRHAPVGDDGGRPRLQLADRSRCG